ncbi:MAG TPA: hypothetical protein VGN11_12480 [Candidatus Baltobacteraceae bacterium]|nr:hypothetical protein [Candidatus Baltobacteraceae bacterium]
MRILPLVALVVLAFTMPGCSSLKERLHRSTAPEPTPTPDTLASHLGIATPFEKAVRGIAFRPYLPSRQLLDVALIAPLTGADTRANRGLALEYVAAGQALVLSEWPASARRTGPEPPPTAGPCEIVAFDANTALWSTRSGTLMTLRPDGKVKPSRIFAEARRLLRRGACS